MVTLHQPPPPQLVVDPPSHTFVCLPNTNFCRLTNDNPLTAFGFLRYTLASQCCLLATIAQHQSSTTAAGWAQVRHKLWCRQITTSVAATLPTWRPSLCRHECVLLINMGNGNLTQQANHGLPATTTLAVHGPWPAYPGRGRWAAWDLTALFSGVMCAFSLNSKMKLHTQYVPKTLDCLTNT